ncbi:putative MFS family arabinose efflux permease [Saccharothrix carnea]|uniref:Putative MFS family arabinose efflux permease n=1 Tax=Saccharothrix carnea TaxID=1280637 RepID=A0A2P8ID30_SACCR|nr:MFS transporter [Saccharothrix carnea]PSL56369.1 putative MFS family arabinose efflux permease [Saccharothrix carnea]
MPLPRDFRLFWVSDAVNQFGIAVYTFVLPVVAIEALDASAFQVGVLTAAGTAAFLVIGLPVGVYVDRVRKRPVLVWSAVGRGLVLATVPVAAWLGALTFGHVLAAALVAGVLTVFSEVASQAYLPTLVERDGLTGANGRLVSTQQVARLSGRPVSGPLVQFLGSANAVLAITVSFLVSALLLRGVRTPERAVERRERALRAEMAEGLRFVFGHPLLRPVVFCTTWFNLTNAMWGAVNVLFLLRDLALSTTVAAVLLGVGGAGGALAGLVAGRLARFGQVRLVWLSLLVTQPLWVLVPLAERGWRVALFAVATLVTSAGVVVYNVAQVSLRQALCPDRLLGRMNASVRFLAWGAMPVGAVAGGALAEWVGVRNTLWIASVGMLLSVVWVLLSPLRSMRDLPVITSVERHG